MVLAAHALAWCIVGMQGHFQGTVGGLQGGLSVLVRILAIGRGYHSLEHRSLATIPD